MRVRLIALSGILTIAGCAAYDGAFTAQRMTAIYSPPVRLGGNGSMMFIGTPEQPANRRPILILVAQHQGVVLSMYTPGLVNCPYPTFNGQDTSSFKVISEAAFRETDRLSPHQLKRKIELSKTMRKHNQNLFRTRHDQLRQVCPNVQLEAP